MTSPVPSSLGLTPVEVAAVLEAAASAPSVHNSQPWRFRVLADRIELHADFSRRLPATDPDDRELRLACGAALTNVRIALEALGIRPLVTLLPRDCGPTALAVIRRGGHTQPTTQLTDLRRAILVRRTNRKPFRDIPLTATTHGLSASFITQPIEVPACRDELRRLLGAGITAQTILRVGHGSPVAPTPRRPMADLLIDATPALPGGSS